MSEINGNNPESPQKAQRSEAQRGASRRNALTHGLTAKTLTLENENPEQFLDLHAQYVETFEPTDAFELDCVQKMAFAKWREHRIWIAETATLNMEMNRAAEAVAAEFQSFEEPVRIAHALEASLFRSSALHTVDRLEARYGRMFRQALRDLREHRKCKNCKTTLAISNKTHDREIPNADPI